MKKLGLIVTYKNEKGEELFFMPALVEESDAKDLGIIIYDDSHNNITPQYNASIQELKQRFTTTLQNKKINLNDNQLYVLHNFIRYNAERIIDAEDNITYQNLVKIKEINAPQFKTIPPDTENASDTEFFHLDLGKLSDTEIIAFNLGKFRFNPFQSENLKEKANHLEIANTDQVLVLNHFFPNIKHEISVDPLPSVSSENNNDNAARPPVLKKSPSPLIQNEASSTNNLDVKPARAALETEPNPTYFATWLTKQPVKPHSINNKLDVLKDTAHSFVISALQTSSTNSAALTKQTLLAWVKQPGAFQLAGDKYFDATHYSEFANWLEEQNDTGLANQLQHLWNPSVQSVAAKQYRNFLDDIVGQRIAFIGNTIVNEQNILQQHFKRERAHWGLLSALKDSTTGSVKKELLSWVNQTNTLYEIKDGAVNLNNEFARWLMDQDDKDLTTCLHKLYTAPTLTPAVSKQYFRFLENIVRKRMIALEDKVPNSENVLEANLKKTIATEAKPTVGYVVFPSTAKVPAIKLISELEQQTQYNLVFGAHPNKTLDSNVEKTEIVGKFHSQFNQQANWLTWKRTDQLIIPAKAKQDCFLIKINSSNGIASTNVNAMQKSLDVEYNKYANVFKAAINKGIKQLHLIPDPNLNSRVSLCLQIIAANKEAKAADYKFDAIFVANIDQLSLDQINNFVEKEINYIARINHYIEPEKSRSQQTNTVVSPVKSSATMLVAYHTHAKDYAELVKLLEQQKAAHDKEMKKTKEKNKEFTIEVKAGKSEYFNLPIDLQVTAAKAAGILEKNIKGIPKNEEVSPPEKSKKSKSIVPPTKSKASAAPSIVREDVPMFTMELARWLAGESLYQPDMAHHGKKGLPLLLGPRASWITHANHASGIPKQVAQNREKVKELVFLLLKNKFSELNKSDKKQYTKYLLELKEYLQKLCSPDDKLAKTIYSINKNRVTEFSYMTSVLLGLQEKFNQHSTDIIANTIFEYLHVTPQVAIETGNLELLQFLANAGMPLGKDETDAIALCIRKLHNTENSTDWRIIEWLAQKNFRQIKTEIIDGTSEAVMLLTALFKATIQLKIKSAEQPPYYAEYSEYLKRVKYFVNYFYSYAPESISALLVSTCENPTDLVNWLHCLLTVPTNNPAVIQKLITEIAKYQNEKNIINKLNDLLIAMANGELDSAYLLKIVNLYPLEKIEAKFCKHLIEQAQVKTNIKFLREFSLYYNSKPLAYSPLPDAPDYLNRVDNGIALTQYIELHKSSSKLHSRNLTADWINKCLKQLNHSHNELDKVVLASLFLHDKSSSLFQELLEHVNKNRVQAPLPSPEPKNNADNIEIYEHDEPAAAEPHDKSSDSASVSQMKAIDEAADEPVKLSLPSSSTKLNSRQLIDEIKSLIDNPTFSQAVALQILARAHKLESGRSYKFGNADTKQKINWEIKVLHRAVEIVLINYATHNSDAVLETAAHNVIRKTAENFESENFNVRTKFLQDLRIPSFSPYNATTLWLSNYQKESQPNFFKPVIEHSEFTFGHSRQLSEKWLNSIAKIALTPEVIEIYYYAYSTLYQQSKKSELADSLKRNLATALGLDLETSSLLITERMKKAKYCQDEKTNYEQLLETLFNNLHRKESAIGYKLAHILPFSIKDKVDEITALQSVITAIVTNRPLNSSNSSSSFNKLAEILVEFGVTLDLLPNANDDSDPNAWTVTNKQGSTCLLKTWCNLSYNEAAISSLTMQPR